MVVVFVAEIKNDSCPAAGFGLGYVGCITMVFQDHVRPMETDFCICMCGHVVKEPYQSVHGFLVSF